MQSWSIRPLSHYYFHQTVISITLASERTNALIYPNAAPGYNTTGRARIWNGAQSEWPVLSTMIFPHNREFYILKTSLSIIKYTCFKNSCKILAKDFFKKQRNMVGRLFDTAQIKESLQWNRVCSNVNKYRL